MTGFWVNTLFMLPAVVSVIPWVVAVAIRQAPERAELAWAWAGAAEILSLAPFAVGILISPLALGGIFIDPAGKAYYFAVLIASAGLILAASALMPGSLTLMDTLPGPGRSTPRLERMGGRRVGVSVLASYYILLAGAVFYFAGK